MISAGRILPLQWRVPGYAQFRAAVQNRSSGAFYTSCKNEATQLDFAVFKCYARLLTPGLVQFLQGVVVVAGQDLFRPLVRAVVDKVFPILSQVLKVLSSAVVLNIAACCLWRG